MQKAIIAALIMAATQTWAQTNGMLAFTSSMFSVLDTETSAVISVALTETSNGTVTVQYRTRDGTATANVDYEATTGTLMFASSPLTNTFEIQILTTNGISSDRTLSIELFNLTGPATLGNQSNATLTIRSTATAEINFATNRFLVVRRARVATITVIRSGDSSEQATVDYVATNGTAISFVDFVPTSGTLIFQPSETEKSFGFSVLETNGFGPNKTVEVELFNASGATLGDTNTAEVVIANDKTQTITLTNDNDVVTLTLKHAGTMETIEEVPADINLEGTDETSVLAVKIKKAKIDGTGTIEVTSITSDGAIGTIDAPGMDLTGDVDLNGGSLRKLRVHDISDAMITAGGETTNLTRITAHQIANTVIDIGSRLSLTAANFLGTNSSITAPSADNISMRGDTKQNIPGDFEASVELIGADVETNQFTLGRLFVAATMNGAIIMVDDGNVGSISVRRMTSSEITIGFSPTGESLLAGGDFTEGLTLQALNVRNNFQNSAIVAANIGTVHLGSVVPDNGGDPFGILADESIGSVTVKSPPFHWQPNGPSDQTLGDFHVIH